MPSETREFQLHQMPDDAWWEKLRHRLQVLKNDYVPEGFSGEALLCSLLKWAKRTLKTQEAPFAAGVLAVLNDEGEAGERLEQIAEEMMAKPRTPETYSEPAGGQRLEVWADRMRQESPLRIAEDW